MSLNKFLIVAVLLLSAVSAFWTLGDKALGDHESFVSVTTREMSESGDFIWPTCNGQPRLQKTPLGYWLVAAASGLTGKIDEFTTRFPNALFAVFTVAAILYFVNIFTDLRTAAISSMVWATSLAFIRYSHNARPEMLLTFFISVCFLSFYAADTANTRGRQIIYMLIFWASFGLGNLAKGPAPIPLVGLPIFCYIAINRKFRDIPKYLPVAGTLIFLALALPWPLAIAAKCNWDMSLWKMEFVDRFFGNYVPGNEPFYYYGYMMFAFIAPWAAFLPMALAAPFFKVWSDKRRFMWFLWIAFVADLLFLTVSGGKRQHYILPLMPAAAILIGFIINDMVYGRKAYNSKYARDVLIWHSLAVIVGSAAIVIYIAKTHPQIIIQSLIFAAAAVFLTAIILILFAYKKKTSGICLVFGSVVLLIMLSQVFFINKLNRSSFTQNFIAEVKQHVSPSDKIIAHRYIPTRSVHYFGSVVEQQETIEDTYQQYENGSWVLAIADNIEELKQDDRFEMVYYHPNPEFKDQRKFGWALFHK